MSKFVAIVKFSGEHNPDLLAGEIMELLVTKYAIHSVVVSRLGFPPFGAVIAESAAKPNEGVEDAKG